MSLAGAVGAMSLGCGMGDIMAISGLAAKVYTAYKDAPGDYRNISDEVKSLRIVIDKAIKHLSDPTLSNNYLQEGQEVLTGCQNVLKDLEALIVKYNSLASANTSQVIDRIKLGTEDIATLRIRLISNTGLLNGFIQSCDSHKLDKMQEQLNNVLGLGLHRTVSRDSIVSFAGSINTKKAFKEFCKGLFEIGVTADIIRQKEKEIQDLLKPATSNQTDDSAFVDSSQLPDVGTSSGAEISPISATLSTENPRSRSRLGWIRPQIDFIAGPLMLSAAETGDTKRLISTLRYVRNINFANDQKATALHLAAAGGHEDAVQRLLSKGASIEAMSDENETPLHCAASGGHTGTVELLLSKGALAKAMNKDNKTPWNLAARGSHTDTMELLLPKGVPIQALRFSLHDAAWSGYTSIVELLLLKGASIEAIDYYKDTPLHHAASHGHTGTVELLLSKGASIAARNECNQTPLHRAASNGHTGTVKLLLLKAALIEAMNKNGETPLHCATSSGHTSTVELLLSKGASIEAIDYHSNTPLHDAAWIGRNGTVELLLSKGASIAARNKNNRTPLDLATMNRHTDAMQLLQNKAAELARRGNI